MISIEIHRKELFTQLWPQTIEQEENQGGYVS